MARVLWGFADISCHLETAYPVDAFDGGEDSTHDELGNAHHVPQLCSFCKDQEAIQTKTFKTLFLHPQHCVFSHPTANGILTNRNYAANYFTSVRIVGKVEKA